MSYSKFMQIAATLLLAACEPKIVPLDAVMPPPAVTPAKPAELTLAPESIGPVSFGASLAHIESALGEQAMRLDQADNPECSYVAFKALPKVRFMVEKGKIVRADVEKEIANVTGVKVGDPAERLKQRRPDFKEELHKYLPQGRNFILAGKGNTALLMESDGGTIIRVRAGLQPAVAYVEGCS